MTATQIACPFCNSEAKVVTVRHEVAVGRRRVEVDDEYMQCDACDEAFYTPAQSNQLQERANKQAELDQNLLLPSDHIRIRKGLNFTQPEWEELLGVGEKTAARWESGKVRPNVSTDRLIRLLAANRKNVEILAGINGVALKDSCFVPESVVSAHPFRLAGAPFLPAFEELNSRLILGGSAEDSGVNRRDIKAAADLLQREDYPGTPPLDSARMDAAQVFDSPFPPSSSVAGRRYDH